MLVAGSFGVLGAQVLLLDGAVRTVEGSLSPLAVLLAMLSAGAAKAMIPSPGGIGPVETALMATLTAVGLSFGAAMLAVGLYRGIGLGIPVIAGVFSLKMLRDRGLI